MKIAVCVVASALCLVGCNKGPSVNLKNASGNQVAQAVKRSGMMSSDAMIEPGEWESKVTVQEMNIPGMPPQYAAKMKQMMASNEQRTSKHCVTKDDVKKPKEDFFGADKSCHYEHFTMGGGRIDVQMACKEEGSTQTTKLAGSYTPTTYALDMSSVGIGGGMQNGMTMKMHVEAQRVGECTTKDD
jgi:hypothetical protein